METAKQHWKILQRLGTDLANTIRQFMIIGDGGDDGVIVITEDGQGFWLGTMTFDSDKSKTVTKPTPLDVSELVDMAHGEHHILLLNKRGQIYSMGRNYYGQLGLGTVDDEQCRFTPRLIPIQHNKFISVRCGKWHSVALTDDGKVLVWGGNDFSHCGMPSSIRFVPILRQIPELDPYRVVAIECAGHHSLTLTDQGDVYSWGMNGSGQLGVWSEKSRNNERLSIPKRIPIPSPMKSMAAGSSHTLLLTQTGEVYCCGWNDCGQLGVPTSTKFSVRLVKVGGLPSISQILSHCGTKLSIALSFDLRCFVWGELNDGLSVSTPRELPQFYSTVESPLSFYSLQRNTPHSVTIPETPLILSARMSRMFDNLETSPDVQFVVEQRTIHAHRNILSNSSDYFARMFSETWMAPVDPEDPIVRVTITDHSYPVFYALLLFLYTDCLEVPNELQPELFELANLYLVPGLQQLCLFRMRTTLTPVTCCLYYPLTHRHSLLPELATFQQELVQFASTRMSEVKNSAAYQSMESDLRDILTNAAHKTSNK